MSNQIMILHCWFTARELHWTDELGIFAMFISERCKINRARLQLSPSTDKGRSSTRNPQWSELEVMAYLRKKYHVCRRWHKNLQSLAFTIINNRQGNSTHSQSSPGEPLNKDWALRNFVALSSTEAFALEWMIGASDSIIYSNILIEANVVRYMYTIYH